MDQFVPHRYHLSPRQFGMRCPCIVGHFACRFAKYQQLMYHGALKHLVFLKIFPGISSGELKYFVHSFSYVRYV